jgi:hypothetical protein
MPGDASDHAGTDTGRSARAWATIKRPQTVAEGCTRRSCGTHQPSHDSKTRARVDPQACAPTARRATAVLPSTGQVVVQERSESNIHRTQQVWAAAAGAPTATCRRVVLGKRVCADTTQCVVCCARTPGAAPTPLLGGARQGSGVTYPTDRARLQRRQRKRDAPRAGAGISRNRRRPHLALRGRLNANAGRRARYTCRASCREAEVTSPREGMTATRRLGQRKAPLDVTCHGVFSGEPVCGDTSRCAAGCARRSVAAPASLWE